MNQKLHPSDAPPLIQMREIVKIFHTPAGDFPALRGVDVDVHAGEFVSVVGKSGSGKSTLVNMLTGIDHPTSGSVIIDETPIHTLNESRMSRWRGRNLGIVFQFYQLLPTLSLLENVLLPMDIANVHPSAERERRALALLELVGAEAEAHQMPAAVSGGVQQCAAVARALANDPPLIIADEPTGNLDSRSAERIFGLFEELVEGGKTVIMVTHDPTLARRTTRTLQLADGELINETIAGTLSPLDPGQLLHATHEAQIRHFAPGASIIRQGEINRSLYLIAQGEVEVLLEDGEGGASIARLGPGQYFGEIGTLMAGRALASVRAGSAAPVKVVVLERRLLSDLLQEAGELRAQLHEVARSRMEENTALRLVQRLRERRGA